MRNAVALLCASVLELLSCIPKGGSYLVSGSVLDENSNGIPSANVTLVSAGMTTVSGADGSYAFKLAVQPNTLVLTAQAAGYARTSRVVPASLFTAHPRVAIMMRVPQSITTVALPTAAGTVATAQVVDSDGATVLTLSPNSLVTPLGEVVQGNVQVALTYWHPKKSLATVPGTLLTPSGLGGNAQLETFGMADIEVSQNGNLLQVASGQTLGLQVNVPPAQWLNLGARIGSSNAQPNLYSLDMNTGLWKLEATLANTENFAFDPNTGIFRARLPHLSAWNVDGVQTNQGGCVQGHAADSVGNPASNKQVRVYLLDRDEVKDFVATTDSNGDYCVNTGYTPPDNYAIEQVPYYVSGADSVTDSTQCNPMPPYCSDCQFEPLYCSNCASRSVSVCADNGAELSQWGDNSCVNLPTCNASSSQQQVVACGYKYVDSCNPQSPVVTITPCHFCSGAPATCSAVVATGAAATYEAMAGVNGSCGNLGTVVLGATAPGGAGSGGTTGSCGTILQEGDPCEPSANPLCCAPGLCCSDYLCVPTAN